MAASTRAFGRRDCNKAKETSRKILNKPSRACGKKGF
jgi:hypothetical protein